MQVSGALLFQLGALLAALAVLGAVARRFALSPIPVYLLAGLSLGKGGIWPVAAAGEFIMTGAPIGIVSAAADLGPGVLRDRIRQQHAPSSAVGRCRHRPQRRTRRGGRVAAGLGRRRHPGLGRRHLHLLVGCHRAPVGGPAPARQPGNTGRAVGAGARGFRDGGLPAAVRGAGVGWQLAGGRRRHARGGRRAARGVCRVLSLGPSRRPAGGTLRFRAAVAEGPGRSP